MADNRTMAELLQAPTEGYEDTIVIPEITTNNFELKHGLINLVQNKQFFEHDKEDPHAHIRIGIFNDLLRACLHHGFSELHQLDTFYNALNVNDQDSLNSAAGGNFLDKMPRQCLKIIESKSKVRQSRAKAVVTKVEDDPNSSKINPFYYDLEGDILLLEAILNSKPSPPLYNQEQNLPSFKELKAYEAQTVKSSVDEPLEDCPDCKVSRALTSSASFWES
nr:reverse transcriptase domain-containing protein [Tanacetum cinerariifolium]